MELNKKITEVYSGDGYGGMVVIELDWKQDVTFERGELNDGFESIEDYFNSKTYDWYENILDWYYGVNEYKSISVE